MIFAADELINLALGLLWPFLRIGALFVSAPIFGARAVPVRIRIVLALLITMIIVPLLPPAPAADPFTPAGVVIGVQQVLIGLAMGFALQIVFGACVLAGQAAAGGMGLGFAALLDPQNGVSSTVLGAFYTILATLFFVAGNGHLALIEAVIGSFQTLPIAADGLSRAGLWQLVALGSTLFASGLALALPAMAALLLTNLAFGVMTRAAPSLNPFAVGFPVSLMTGLVVLAVTLPALGDQLGALFAAGFDRIGVVLAAGD
jgi:flagellar biosynthetic protein FliR